MKTKKKYQQGGQKTGIKPDPNVSTKPFPMPPEKYKSGGSVSKKKK